MALAHALPEKWRGGTLCDPQILLQFPHVGPEPQIVFHLDEEPDWADGRRYERIVGVPLTPWRRQNGALLVKGRRRAGRGGGRSPDAVMLTPDLLHCGGVNRTGSPRYGVYVRWLQAA